MANIIIDNAQFKIGCACQPFLEVMGEKLFLGSV